LLTPLAKACGTDVGVEVTSLGVQVHGGMGFVEEGGAAQFYRDARIAPIYEGTNGIQAIDLYGRKLLGDRGEAMGVLIAEARATAGSHHPKFAGAIDALEEATAYMLAAAREDALAGAYAYLQLAGDVVGGMLLIQGGVRDANPEQAAMLRFYARTVLARAPARLAEIKLGAAVLNSADFAT
jgi:3-(methylthio)propanoyl-CoA dehydrogenase